MSSALLVGKLLLAVHVGSSGWTNVRLVRVSLSRSGRSRNLHLRFLGAGLLENDGAGERLAGDELLPRLQQHHMISVSREFDRLVLWNRNRLDLAHGGRAFAAIDGVLYGKIRKRTADAQYRVGFGRIVSDRHQ